MAFRGAEVARQAVAPVEEDLGLDGRDHRVHAFGFPAFGVEGPPAVVPEGVDGVVAGDELLDAGEGVVDELAAVGLGLQGGDAVGLVAPVVEAVVEADLEAVAARRGDDLGGEVALRPGLGGAEAGQLAMVKAEAVVVHGGEDDVAHPGLFGQGAEGVGVEVLGVELVRQLGVVGGGDRLLVHGPFAAPEHAVQAEMHEHPEPGVGEPPHVNLSAAHVIPLPLWG